MSGATARSSLPSLAEIAARLDALLQAGRHAEPSGILVPRAGPVARLAVALEPAPDLPDRLAADGFDAVLLHRSHGFEPPPGLGVLAYHAPLDDRLGLGSPNPWLADALGLSGIEALGPKAILASAPPDLRERVRSLFGGEDSYHAGPARPVRRAVLASAMNDALVREAAASGAGLYVTGQWREPGADAVAETGIAVQAVGHERSERWALRVVARELRAAFAGLAVVELR